VAQAAATLDIPVRRFLEMLRDAGLGSLPGTEHGQEFAPEQMEAVIAAARRRPEQRTTLYQPVPAERRAASFNATALADLVMTPFSKVVAGAHAAAPG
jgi:FO synthase